MKLPDIILTAAYSAIYFFIIGISAMLTVFIIPGYSFIFIPILIALLSGSIYYLLALKVPKFGSITLMASIIGIFYLISGRYPAAIIVSILFGFIADRVALIGNYRNQVSLFISYIIFSFSNEVSLNATNLERVEYLLNQLQLSHLKDHHPMNLSGGEKQRVMIAAALASNKEILIFDEPTSGFDYENMKRFGQLLNNLKKENILILVITHDNELVSKWCERVIDVTKYKTDK